MPILNKSTFGDFFSRYTPLPEIHSLRHDLGFIAEDQGDFHVNVTASLGEDSWAELLDECAKRGRRFIAHCAPGVRLPEALHRGELKAPLMPRPFSEDLGKTEVIESTDLDATVALLISKNPDWLVFDISESKPADLLLRLNAEFNQETLSFDFNESVGALLKALSEHKNVILKGRFSEELADALTRLLLARVQNPSSRSQLILVSHDATPFNYLSCRVLHTVTPDEKKSLLQKKYPQSIQEITPLIEQESLSQLEARARFLSIYPGSNSDKTWQGLQD